MGALALLVPAVAQAGPSARSASVVDWTAPTPADGTRFTAAADSQMKILLAASAPGGQALHVQIRTSGSVPRGGSLQTADGNPAGATFTWTPTRAQVGEHRVTFTAGAAGLPAGNASPRTFVLRVIAAGTKPPPPPPGQPPPRTIWPKRTLLSDYRGETYKWAYVLRRAAVRSGPADHARVISHLSRVTPEYFPNLVQTLSSVRYRNGHTWVRVRLAILPNSRTAWVRRAALGRYRTVRSRLLVDRRRLRATLYRRGKPIFRTIIGVGQSRWPTPRGDFYVREVLTGYSMPVYGPVAIGISARSPVLTDWPGGGFIGIHGTNQPGILPGRVSHGCVRMRNGAILRLKRLLPLGAPVQVR